MYILFIQGEGRGITSFLCSFVAGNGHDLARESHLLSWKPFICMLLVVRHRNSIYSCSELEACAPAIEILCDKEI